MEHVDTCYYCQSRNTYEFNDKIVNPEDNTLKVSIECYDCGNMYELIFKDDKLIAVW